MKRKFTVAWVVWFALFLVIEFVAIFNDESGDTLSEHVWSLTALSALLWWLFAGFLVWLTAHLLGPRMRKWINTWRNQ